MNFYKCECGYWKEKECQKHAVGYQVQNSMGKLVEICYFSYGIKRQTNPDRLTLTGREKDVAILRVDAAERFVRKFQLSLHRVWKITEQKI